MVQNQKNCLSVISKGFYGNRNPVFTASTTVSAILSGVLPLSVYGIAFWSVHGPKCIYQGICLISGFAVGLGFPHCGVYGQPAAQGAIGLKAEIKYPAEVKVLKCG